MFPSLEESDTLMNAYSRSPLQAGAVSARQPCDKLESLRSDTLTVRRRREVVRTAAPPMVVQLVLPTRSKRVNASGKGGQP